jgi:hypothetical protein
MMASQCCRVEECEVEKFAGSSVFYTGRGIHTSSCESFSRLAREVSALRLRVAGTAVMPGAVAINAVMRSRELL